LIAVFNPSPKEANGANGSKAAAIADLDKNDLLELLEFVIDKYFMYLEK
jgi:hypothetical protein